MLNVSTCSFSLLFTYIVIIVHVMLTGFVKNLEKKDIEQQLRDLNWKLCEKEFEMTVTHVITPNFAKLTLKSLVAALTYHSELSFFEFFDFQSKKWIVYPAWVNACHEKKQIVPEASFG